MSYFPQGFDPRSSAAGILQLADVATPDGNFGFIVGQNGRFVDVDGKEWIGSTLISANGTKLSTGGEAVAEAVTFSFFQDPAHPNTLIQELHDLGPDYVKGYPLTRYVQPIGELSELYAPRYAPIPAQVRIMDHLTFGVPNDLVRTITLHLESSLRTRGDAEKLFYNTADHERQLGEPNQSYEFVPTDPREEESMYS